ncbi:MAG: glycosyl hydrolase 53 family protein [Paludibacteraceae bacterium]|nr:glycosyl hydrolase 53 family protein [Paludibacteraceae bacterium]
MKKHSLFILFVLACVSVCAQANSTRYVGGDISALPLYEQHNSAYKDVSGKNISDLVTWFVNDCGWNTFRVRIFVNPTKKDQDGSTNPTVCQDLEYVTKLGKRIKNAGAYFMLDFHYSDTWVDATHIQAPAAWKGKSDAEMAKALGEYTHNVLTTLNEAGATPDLVQVGNEIMYGLCGIKVKPYDDNSSNWDGYLGLLKAGCDTVRSLCPEAKIIIHTDRPTNNSHNDYYYKKLIDGGVDFDVIGLSYYPFWHGYLTYPQVSSKTDKNYLKSSLLHLKNKFPDKEVQIVETAYNFQYWPTEGVNTDTRDAWACSVAGQYNFVKDLVDALKPLENVTGICYWFPEEAGNGDDTNWDTSNGTVITTWLNRGFWNENATQSGHAINKTASVSGTKTAADVCAPYYMKNFYNESTEALEIAKPEAPQSRKILREGRILIERGGSLYGLDGSRQ